MTHTNPYFNMYPSVMNFLIWCILILRYSYSFPDFADINFNSSLIRYEVLDILEFTSDRKRMSVVVKDCQSGKKFILSKGADEAILPHAYAGKLFLSHSCCVR